MWYLLVEDSKFPLTASFGSNFMGERKVPRGSWATPPLIGYPFKFVLYVQDLEKSAPDFNIPPLFKTLMFPSVTNPTKGSYLRIADHPTSMNYLPRVLYLSCNCRSRFHSWRPPTLPTWVYFALVFISPPSFGLFTAFLTITFFLNSLWRL